MTPVIVTALQFAQLYPGIGVTQQDSWRKAFNAAALEFELNTLQRLAAFHAQISHESYGLKHQEESFNYTPERLLAVFPRHFSTVKQAKDYINRGPQAIANRVYANRMGNGDEASGDGYRYRGRGPTALTGKANYIEFGTALGLPLAEKPEQAKEMVPGARIAARYFYTRGCCELADQDDIEAITKRINGGSIGLADRVQRWLHARRILGLDPPDAA